MLCTRVYAAGLITSMPPVLRTHRKSQEVKRQKGVVPVRAVHKLQEFQLPQDPDFDSAKVGLRPASLATQVRSRPIRSKHKDAKNSRPERGVFSGASLDATGALRPLLRKS